MDAMLQRYKWVRLQTSECRVPFWPLIELAIIELVGAHTHTQILVEFQVLKKGIHPKKSGRATEK